MFHLGLVMVTTVQRVKVKTYFTVICCNPIRQDFLIGQFKMRKFMRKYRQKRGETYRVSKLFK